MNIEEIKQLTNKAVKPVTGGHPWTGEYRVGTRRYELALMLDEAKRLESIVLFHVVNWRKSSIPSPRKNLCTGELTFLLRIRWSYALQGADVYLDGHKVDSESWRRPQLLEVLEGAHELRFLKAGYEPVIRHIDLKPDDRGEQLVDLPD